MANWTKTAQTKTGREGLSRWKVRHWPHKVGHLCPSLPAEASFPCQGSRGDEGQSFVLECGGLRAGRQGGQGSNGRSMGHPYSRHAMLRDVFLSTSEDEGLPTTPQPCLHARA